MAKVKSANDRHRRIHKAWVVLATVAAVAMLLVGGLAWWAYAFTTTNVKNELAQQQIFFPEADSPGLNALPAADKAAVSKYAGQQLLTGAQAKVFANNYIAVHLSEVAGGKTYAQVSGAALADPTNAKLQGQANTLFKGETLRGLLLGDAYAFWTVGHIAQIVAVVMFVAAGLTLVAIAVVLKHVRLL